MKHWNETIWLTFGGSHPASSVENRQWIQGDISQLAGQCIRPGEKWHWPSDQNYPDFLTPFLDFLILYVWWRWGWRICFSNKISMMLMLLSGGHTVRTTDLYYSNRGGNAVGTKWTDLKYNLEKRLRRHADLPILENIRVRKYSYENWMRENTRKF